VLREAQMIGKVTTSQTKKLFKDFLLLNTAQGRVINDRNKQITEELVLLDVQTRYAGDQEDLLDYRLKAAKLDLDTTNSLLRIDKERLKLREAYVKLADLEAQRRDAKMRESLQDYKNVIENVSEAFASSLSEAISDKILGRESDVDWRTALAEQFAGGAGDMVAGMFQRGIFGNQGLLSKGAASIFDLNTKELDFLFPKTELEIIDSGLAGIKQEIINLHETIKVLESLDNLIQENTLKTADATAGIRDRYIGGSGTTPEFLYDKYKGKFISPDDVKDSMEETIIQAYNNGSPGTRTLVAANMRGKGQYDLFGPNFGRGSGSSGGVTSTGGVTQVRNTYDVTKKVQAETKMSQREASIFQNNLRQIWDRLNAEVKSITNMLNNPGGRTIKGVEEMPINKSLPRNRGETSWLDENLTKLGTTITENATAVGNSLKNTLDFGFEDLIVNGNFNAKMLASNFVGGIGQSFMNSATGAVTSTIMGSLGFAAKGGIAMGGIKGYANGGIVSAPHIGVVGEGKYNEAIVPLPDGKAIPVIGNTGGGNNNVTVNVSVDSNGQANAQAEGEGNMQQLGYQISQVVQEEIMRQQRPGGLLNSTGTRSY